MRSAILLLLMMTFLQIPAAEGGDKDAAPFMPDTVWDEHEAPASRNQDGSVAEAAGKMAFGLVVVVGLAIGVAWWIRRVGKGRFLPGGNGRHLEMVESLSVGLKQSVGVVRLGDQVLIIGQTETTISHLATMPVSVLDGDSDGAARPRPSIDVTDEPVAPAPAGEDPPASGDTSVARFHQRLKEVLKR